MPRIFHALAIALLIGSAVYVYKIKYDTMGLRSEVVRLEKQIAHERDLIALLKAEWQKLNSPERIQMLSDGHLDLVPLMASQIVRWQDVPERQAPVDSIGDKLGALGLIDHPTSQKSPDITGSVKKKD
ncbi:MAG: hypothetical protein RLZZ496_1921 [Pseudomonadota bacterium]|jgi:hypothetical protein|nr:hypothetical protein [Alphaproteobacteria bacterium]